MQRNQQGIKPKLKNFMSLQSSGHLRSETDQSRSTTQKKVRHNAYAHKKKHKTPKESKRPRVSKNATSSSSHMAKFEPDSHRPRDYKEKAKKGAREKAAKSRDVEVEITKFYKEIASKKSIKPIKFATKAKEISNEVMPEKIKTLTKKPVVSRMGKTDPTLKSEDITERICNNENKGKLFDENGQPFWTQVLFDQAEADKEGVEVEGRITSEHVVKYLEGGISFTPAPTEKPKLDETESVEVLKSRDEAYFSDDVINGNTLKNIIEHSATALSRCTGNDDGERKKTISSGSRSPNCDTEVGELKVKESHSATPLPVRIHFNLRLTQTVVYDRSNPISSINEYLENQRKKMRSKNSSHECFSRQSKDV
ncbi:unnamed protein product [Caenorhabditis bovis]|uniref:Uncharacterized protein n=1 Tax=Caenorhabditis bovis TaxID=2654633 RepID=A0A8S1F5V0_9PELO|nr:unnamed protein product [Caenorhabditis bovis]